MKLGFWDAPCSTWKEPIGHDFEPLPGLKVRLSTRVILSGRRVFICNMAIAPLLPHYCGDYNTASSRTTEGLKLAELPSTDVPLTEPTG